jgi:hypothetical protein
MAMGRREKDIKLLVEKFIKLVESLNPGERLSIKKVGKKKRPAAAKAGKKPVPKAKTAKAKQGR